MSSSRRGRTALCALVFALVAGRAHAQGPKRLLAAPSCAVPPAPFARSLQIELAAIGPDCCVLAPAATPGEQSITLTLDPCDTEAPQLAISVTDAATGRSERRELPLGDVPAHARPRALALAVAELVRAVTAPAAAPPPPPPVATAPSPPPAPPPAPARPRAAIAAEGELRAYPSRGAQLWGGRLTGAVAAARWFGALSLTAAAGRETFAPGAVAMRLLGVGVSAGPLLARGRASVALGPTVELGWGWAGGEAASPGVVSGDGGTLVASLGARGTLTFAVTPRLDLRAAVEGGGVIHGLRAEVAGRDPTGVGGPYVIVGLGLDVRWPL